jgi:Tfp pilus assembly protein PilF
VVTRKEGQKERQDQCRLALAYIYMVTERGKLAQFELESLIQNGFEEARVYTMLGYAAWEQKDYDNSIEYYKKALAIDANNTTAMNALGYILVDSERDINKGLEFCRKAVDKVPDNAAYLDSLGWAYYKSGNVTDARNWLRRALGLAPHEELIKAHMRAIAGSEE